MNLNRGNRLQEIQAMPPGPAKLRARIEYLEHCYRHDDISRDTRADFSKQIDTLRKELLDA